MRKRRKGGKIEEKRVKVIRVIEIKKIRIRWRFVEREKKIRR